MTTFEKPISHGVINALESSHLKLNIHTPEPCHVHLDNDTIVWIFLKTSITHPDKNIHDLSSTLLMTTSLRPLNPKNSPMPFIPHSLYFHPPSLKPNKSSSHVEVEKDPLADPMEWCHAQIAAISVKELPVSRQSLKAEASLNAKLFPSCIDEVPKQCKFSWVPKDHTKGKELYL
ncbi:hypothetical protein AMTR_s00096p00097970 [Amborella trichopoda]|uniref:Uncharacterized protein n=1 Tax=Amborella trichopoda TaxID=13333 RepID=W1P469_AMBTC|nr:hypothetical protein AMTR_s00096p00097970 [Amborella trichopoda]